MVMGMTEGMEDWVLVRVLDLVVQELHLLDSEVQELRLLDLVVQELLPLVLQVQALLVLALQALSALQHHLVQVLSHSERIFIIYEPTIYCNKKSININIYLSPILLQF